MITKIWAHRGSSYEMPENTLEAFELAISQGADGLELDVHLTGDGHIVVTHDETVERVSNGEGPVNEYGIKSIKKLSFSKLFPNMPPCTIPTLAEVYDLIAPTNLTVNVELKNMRYLYPELPQKLIDLERAHKMQGRVSYSSFNHFSLKELKKLNPKAEIGLLYTEHIVDPWIYAKRLKAKAIHPYFQSLKAYPKTLEMAHDKKIKVNAWTADNLSDIDYLIKLGVDAIMTNKPTLAIYRANVIYKAKK